MEEPIYTTTGQLYDFFGEIHTIWANLKSNIR